MVCAASRNGRTIWSAVGLRPIQTPTTTPSTTTDHRGDQHRGQGVHGVLPQPERPSDQAEADGGDRAPRSRPPTIAAIAVSAAKVSHHGELSSSVCSGSSAHAVTTSLMPLVTPEKVVCAQFGHGVRDVDDVRADIESDVR